MPRYGLPNPTKPVTSLSRGSKADLKMTNPLSTKTNFATPSSVTPKVPKKWDEGATPHRLGVKTLRPKMPNGKSSMGK